MKINEFDIVKSFIFTEYDEKPALKIYVKDHMQDVFEKHKEDGFVCCGYDWCTLIIAFIDQNDKLEMKWNIFDYEPSDDELYILSDDENALKKLAIGLEKIFYDTYYIEYLMSQIDYN